MATQQESLKISLDSLSLTLCDSMPTMLWNKPNASYLQSAVPESLQNSFVFVPENGDDDGNSIVVLDKNSLETIHTQSLASFEAINRKSLSMDCQSMITSLAPGEVEKKLSEVLQDNLRMKEVLMQNGLMMKQRLIALMTKQEELSKVHDAHREKFIETKNLVGKLKLENNELKAQLEAKKTKKTERKDGSCQTENTGETADAAVSTTSIDNEFAGEVLRITEKSEGQAREIAQLQKTIETLNQRAEQLDPSLLVELILKHVEAIETKSSEDLTGYNENLQGEQSAGPASQRSSDSQLLENMLKYRKKINHKVLEVLIEREKIKLAQNEFGQNMFADYNSALNELNSLRKENELLKAQQKDSVRIYDERLEEARASLRETERLLEQQRFSVQQEQFRLSEKQCELEREQLHFREEEQRFLEISVALNEELESMRESNDLLQQQCEQYKSDYICEQMSHQKTTTEYHDLLEEMARREN